MKVRERLLELIKILKNKKLTILTIVIVLTMLASIYSALIAKNKPSDRYIATSLMYVNQVSPLLQNNGTNSSINKADIQFFNDQIIQSYISILKSERFMEEVIKNSKMKISPESAIASMVIEQNAQLITLKINGNSETQTEILANTITKHLINEVREKLGFENIKVFYDAESKHVASPQEANKYFFVFMSFIISLLGSIGLVLFLESYDSRKKEVKE